MYTPTVIEMMILEFLSGTNNDRIRYNGIKSSAFFSVIYESEFIRDNKGIYVIHERRAGGARDDKYLCNTRRTYEQR